MLAPGQKTQHQQGLRLECVVKVCVGGRASQESWAWRTGGTPLSKPVLSTCVSAAKESGCGTLGNAEALKFSSTTVTSFLIQSTTGWK